MIGFFIGLFVGGFFGVVIMCCLNVASEADDQMEREQENLLPSKEIAEHKDYQQNATTKESNLLNPYAG